MKHIFVIFLTSILAMMARSQDFVFPKHTGNGKPPIDSSAFFKWPIVSNPVLSSDGHYAAYSVSRETEGKVFLIVKNTSTNWKSEFVMSSNPDYYWFSSDNRYLVISCNNELRFLLLESGESAKVIKIKSSRWPRKNPGKWLAYVSERGNELVLLCLENSKEIRFPTVTSFRFDNRGISMVFQTKDSLGAPNLKWVDLRTGLVSEIWNGSFLPGQAKVGNFSFDETGEQLALLVSRMVPDSNKTTNSIWYYRTGMEKSVMLVNDESQGKEKSYSVTGNPRFNKSGKWIFFELQPPSVDRAPDRSLSDVLVWSYKDPVIQPEQLRRTGKFSIKVLNKDGIPAFSAAVSVNGGKVVQLEHNDEQLVAANAFTGDFVLVRDQSSVGAQYWWQFAPQPSFYIVSLKDGSRRLLRKEIPLNTLTNFSCSPRGRYLVFWDSDKANYFCYDNLTGSISNITGTILNRVTKEPEFTYGLKNEPVAPVAGWHENDSSLLIYDQYDIWLVNPQNKVPPINISMGRGKEEKTKFQLVYGPGEFNEDKTSLIYNYYDTLLLTAFNTIDKSNGFYYKVIGINKQPEKLVMGNYTYYRSYWQIPHFYILGPHLRPIKATNANAWVVLRQSSKEYPNLFFTKDFKQYDSLTDYRPQREVNWLSAELFEWKLSSGRSAQGILYKPENFDPRKKYPIIFSYYKQLSHQLNEFPGLGYCSANINIPWFVSNGYLVFRPDIHYLMVNQTGRKPVGESAYDAIETAARALSKLPYVNGKKMGLQAHSVGGGETNYIIAHSTLFAAAAEFAGVSDPISNFLTLIPFIAPFDHQDKLSGTESFSGVTPWENPKVYINGSTVLNADKITTPLLITHNEKDNQISGKQGIELYLALRRLGKPVWLLQYANGEHDVNGIDALDYTIRLTQFFNYYLKDELPPKWMIEGVPAELKGIEGRFELDSSGKRP